MELFFTLSKEIALKKLEATAEGLTKQQASERLLKYGKNVLKEEKINHLEIFLRQFKNPIIYILIFAAGISVFIGDLKDFTVISLVIIVNSVIGFWQELKAEVSTQALRKMTETHVIVIRDAEEIEIASSELVIGDIVILEEGAVVGADIRLLETNSLMVNESAITGESLPVEKNADKILVENAQIYEMENMALSGTVVVKGKGRGVVCATGKNTYLASIAQKVMEKSPDSPLTKALSSFSKKYISIIFVLIALIGIFMFLENDSPRDIFYTLLAILVSAVPEGLPIVITLSLAVGSLQLAKKSVLTRHLPAVETLGSTTLIATDKTGTVTKGELKVVKHFTKDLDLLKRTAGIANESKDESDGDPLDIALINWLGKEFEDLEIKFEDKKIHPFDTQFKYMAATIEEKDKKITYIKGAYETLFEKAENSEEELEEFKKQHDLMAEEGLRVICFGQTHSHGDFASWKIKIIGLIGFIDPPKEGVHAAVKAANNAGVKIIMITGDNALTAKAIARDVGIYKEGDHVLTGLEIEKMTDDELLKKLENTSVLARIVPEHKYRIVKLLQKSQVVAVTGDGVNDVLALKAADLGIAMGSGTEAAKSTAKMILLDDNLTVIVDAIRRGRIIADNIKKVIYYLVATNLSQIFLIISSIILNLPFPLKPIQILWINLVTDGVLDKTFPFIKEEGDVMKHPPKKISHMFFSREQLINMAYGTLAIGIPNLILYIYMQGKFSPEVTSTTIFTSMVVSQWINGIQSQKQKEPFFKNIKRSLTINKYIWVGVGAGIILQFLAIYVFGSWFGAVPLGLTEYVLILITSLIIFFSIEIKKWIFLKF